MVAVTAVAETVGVTVGVTVVGVTAVAETAGVRVGATVVAVTAVAAPVGVREVERVGVTAVVRVVVATAVAVTAVGVTVGVKEAEARLRASAATPRSARQVEIRDRVWHMG